MATIGERVRVVRKHYNLTQVELGNVIGISGSGVASAETGKSNFTEAALKLICSTYHINYMWLTEGRGDMMQEETADDMIDRMMAGESLLARQIMKAFARLPREEWERLRDLIDALQRDGPP